MGMFDSVGLCHIVEEPKKTQNFWGPIGEIAGKDLGIAEAKKKSLKNAIILQNYYSVDKELRDLEIYEGGNFDVTYGDIVWTFRYEYLCKHEYPEGGLKNYEEYTKKNFGKRGWLDSPFIIATLVGRKKKGKTLAKIKDTEYYFTREMIPHFTLNEGE